MGTTTVTYTVTDLAGNTATSSFTVTVTDDEAPVISNVPADFTVLTAAWFVHCRRHLARSARC